MSLSEKLMSAQDVLLLFLQFGCNLGLNYTIKIVLSVCLCFVFLQIFRLESFGSYFDIDSI